MVARVLHSTELAAGPSRATPVFVRGPQAELPVFVKKDPHLTGDAYDVVSLLSKLPTVEIDQVEARIDSPIVSFGVLRLKDASLETGGRDVIIRAVRIEAIGNAAIRSAVLGAPGGKPGRSGGNVTLIIYGGISGQLSVDLTGGAGGLGTDGVDGAKGASGKSGENSFQTAYDCNNGGGHGTGGPGQPGAPGQDGHRDSPVVMGAF